MTNDIADIADIADKSFFAAWSPWQVALADTAAAEMIRYGITPERLRELAREWLLAHAASEAERAAAELGAAPYRDPYAARRETALPRPEWQREVERGVMFGGACPRCGGPLVIKRMCPQVSPRIRTQLACNSDACDWAAVSEHPWDYLAREGIEGNVEVQ